LAEATGDLKVAPGVRGGEDGCTGADDVPDLTDEELFRLLWLGDIINPGAPAAPVGLGKFDELQARDEFKEVPRLLGDLLAMRQVAGVVVSDDEVA
jgi:hypothetical protein